MLIAWQLGVHSWMSLYCCGCYGSCDPDYLAASRITSTRHDWCPPVNIAPSAAAATAAAAARPIRFAALMLSLHHWMSLIMRPF